MKHEIKSGHRYKLKVVLWPYDTLYFNSLGANHDTVVSGYIMDGGGSSGWLFSDESVSYFEAYIEALPSTQTA